METGNLCRLFAMNSNLYTSKKLEILEGRFNSWKDSRGLSLYKVSLKRINFHFIQIRGTRREVPEQAVTESP